MEIGPEEYKSGLAKAREILTLAQSIFENYKNDIIQKNTGRGKETLLVDDELKAKLDFYRSSASAILEELVAMQDLVKNTTDDTIISKFKDLVERLEENTLVRDKIIDVMHKDLSTILDGLKEIDKEDNALFDKYAISPHDATVGKSYV